MTNLPGSADSARLAARGLTKRFGSITAIEDVSLDIRPGEVRALCGGNGAGKSTLVKILTGVLKPTEGKLEIDGSQRSFANPVDAQRAGLALVAQELSLAPDLSVHDNLWLGHASAPLARRTISTASLAREALDAVGLEAIALDAKAGRLALAERQLLEIARGLVRKASLLILDEPTATLSEREIAKVFGAVRRLKSRNCSVIYITHRMAEVYELCDSVTVMRNGRVITTEPVEDMPRDRLLELMIGRELTEVYPASTTPPGAVMLEVTDLRVPGVVDDFSLQVRAGEIVGVVGQIGSGATESIRALAGLVHNARGVVKVDDRRLRLGASATVLKSGVRFVSEDRAAEGIFLDKPAHTNLIASRLNELSRIGVLTPRGLRRIAGVLARRVSFDTTRLYLGAGRLSGGNQQKLAIGRCSDRRSPGLILMNEPTRGVDMGARAEIYQTLRRLCDEGNAVLLASTDLEEVVGLVDRVVTMFRGRIVAEHARGEFEETVILSEITNTREAA
ncbi:sugar ABC transporter ATP-binding protein (plasmid) [Rhizobium sp. CC1099]|uniref:sugar ABC transporter ATP-binding protein n=1 Tax=Rhizobium sp. CC1099 TaxID=3039160 RepID=UPI0024B20905|nr:sugar ABC transporter ATP-binding protein [Rhizobium sp. CC1099]WFU91355.1 sugar ABC transporter ATP-binding protein [Rhizobium sp. CC1099]